ncbi:MAG: 3-deoxy-D-manno-octulosonic acid transferase [Candidatus Competibacteraceae bacterium]|nr:3-deoxy-D-manno-octulosonic acid transferase [Candidatus Competibacteraceae bacterium]
MRILYSVLLYLAIPLILLRLYWRGRKNPEYRRRWAERFGLVPEFPEKGCLWIHAVSVGEVRAALPLINALQQRYPTCKVLVTTTTPTGSQQVRQALGDSVVHTYLPYDLPGAVGRFLSRVGPRLALIMETEMWPNLYHRCATAGIPLIIANARLSARSTSRYLRLADFTRSVLAHTTLIAAQSELDAERFSALGAPRVRVMDNLKYDLSLPTELPAQGRVLRQSLGISRPVLVAASTHSGEDEQVLDAVLAAQQCLPDLLLVLVPRHPERFDTVANLCQQRGLSVVRRSLGQSCTPTTAVFLGDSMGELLLFYAAADIAFVGGSLVPHGGHNALEAALLGLPVLFGPHMFNFVEVSERLLAARAAWRVANAEELAAKVMQLMSDKPLRQAAGQRARAVVEENRGALANVLALIDRIV